MNWPRPATIIQGSAVAAASTAPSGPNPVRGSAIGRAATTVTRRSGTDTMPTASRVCGRLRGEPSASRARASGGSTVTRTAVAASARHDEHAVRREEPVRLGGPAELARDDHADDGREARLHRDPERRHGARRQ